MMISSRYTMHSCHSKPLSTSSIILSKVDGALHSPKGITVNWYSPPPTENAVFGLSFLLKGTCQYPLARSRVQNHSEPARVSKHSVMFGSGYLSFRVASLTLRRSIQNHTLPSFFDTKSIGEHHGLEHGSITPWANMLSFSSIAASLFA